FFYTLHLYLFCFFMLPRPPTSPLFPYTTLFRSVSAIASAIDVPVYILGIVASIDNPTADERTSTAQHSPLAGALTDLAAATGGRSEEHTSELQSLAYLVCRLLLEKKKHYPVHSN